MAETSFITYQGDTFGKNFKPKWHNLATKIDNAKTFSDLEQVLCHNYLSKMPLYISDFCADYGFVHKGKINGALGKGLRFIESGGTLPVTHYEDPKADDTVCLKVPNNVDDRSEMLKAIVQLDCSGRQPHYLWGHNLFISPDEAETFRQNKIGEINGSIALQYGLLWNYILSIDPWGEKDDHTKNFSDYIQGFGVGSLLGRVVDDTTDRIAACLKKTFELPDVKAEIDKERKFANKYIYHINEWLPRAILPREKNEVKRYKSPTAEIDDAKVKKLYVTNETCSPLENMGALCNCLLTRIHEMLRVSARNSSKFPGNDKDAVKTWGSTKEKFHYFTKTSKDRIVIIMNTYLYDQLKASSGMGSKYTESVANINMINDLLSYSIVGIENIPYGCIKICDKARYSEYTLTAYSGEDTLDQRRLKVFNYHHDIVMGIREFPCACALRIVGLYMNPAVMEALGQFSNLVDL